MPLVKTAAIVLHSRKWGDADRIVTFYTMRLGKLRGSREVHADSRVGWAA